MLISVKLLTKYVIRIYAFGFVHEKFGVCIKGVPKWIQSQKSRLGWVERTAEPLQTETCVPKARFRRRMFHEPNFIRIKAYPNYLDGGLI